jgi:tryptophan-rich sensory protein
VAAVALLNAGSGAARLDTYGWYRSLRKPAYTPPDPVIPAVWSVMYALAALSAARVARHDPSPDRQRALTWWTSQLALNGLWSRLFFGHRRPDLALADSTALFVAATAYARAARRVDRPAALLMLPYVGWVGFATVLNADIVRLND